SRVIPARLIGRKPSGGRVEALLVREVAADAWLALTRPGLREGQEVVFGAERGGPGTRPHPSPLPEGEGIRLPEGAGIGATPTQAALSACVRGVTADGLRRLVFDRGGEALREAIQWVGRMPTPPYIRAPLADPEEYPT